MYGNIPRFKERAVNCMELLQEIDKLLDKIEKTDPYGDVIESFCDGDKTTRHTKRVIEQIKGDLKKIDVEEKERKKKYGLTIMGKEDKPIYFDSIQERNKFIDRIKGIVTYSTFTSDKEIKC